MKIEGIKGEATTSLPQCSNECIELNSFQFGVGRSVSDSGGGGGRSTSPPSLSEVSVTKDMDSTSPKIFEETVAGSSKDVDIFLVRNDGKLFAKYRLNNSLFSGYSVSSGGDRPSESLSLNFAKFETTYTQFDSGGKPVKTVTACWDIAKNEVCTSGGGDPDSDGDGTPDGSDFCPADPAKTNPGICGCGIADNDSDADGIANCNDSCPLDPANDIDDDLVCGDVDNCPADSNADQLDSDSDLAGNVCDADDDNDGVLDADDVASLDPDRCRDADDDDCDDCAVGTDDFGALDDFDPNNDGTDTDGDMMCDAGGSADFAGTPDADDDNDGVLDNDDVAPLDPSICQDLDNDTCDDCSVGTDGFGALSDNNPANDGPDNDVDGVCDAGDTDDENDGLYDDVDVDPLTPSNAFNNSLFGGNEFGTVLSGFVIVTDVGSGEQLSLAAADTSQVSACDLAVLSLSSGDEALVDCGSITVTVVSGSVTAEYTVGGETATATLDEGDSLTFDPDTASFSTGDDSEVTITIGDQTITIGANQTITVQSVNVDIKPDDTQNVVNPQAKGVLTVAILSSAEFDATTVDPLSVKFGPREAIESHRRGHIEDVNRDGLKDMVLHFNIQDIGILENTTELELFGRTTDGGVIMGSDNIVLKGQKIKQN